jgi:isopenicillin N synthase-like dioxygenase
LIIKIRLELVLILVNIFMINLPDIVDYGTITLLFQDNRGGLEVLSPKSGFVPATPIPDTIVINAGDLLQRWSNDVIRSTEHRVVSPTTPPTDDRYPARYSIAYFCNPNWDATIECLSGCYGDTAGGREKRYSPINTHEYLVSRLKATY